MKEILIRIKISERTNKVAFSVERNTEGSALDILELVGALDLIKESQLQKIGELNKV